MEAMPPAPAFSYTLATCGDEIPDYTFAGRLRKTGGGAGYQRYLASGLQQAHDGALHAVLGEHAIDKALVDSQRGEKRKDCRVGEQIEVVFLDDDLLRRVGQKRFRSLPLARRSFDAMRRPYFEFLGIRGVSAHAGDQWN